MLPLDCGNACATAHAFPELYNRQFAQCLVNRALSVPACVHLRRVCAKALYRRMSPRPQLMPKTSNASISARSGSYASSTPVPKATKYFLWNTMFPRYRLFPTFRCNRHRPPLILLCLLDRMLLCFSRRHFPTLLCFPRHLLPLILCFHPCLYPTRRCCHYQCCFHPHHPPQTLLFLYPMIPHGFLTSFWILIRYFWTKYFPVTILDSAPLYIFKPFSNHVILSLVHFKPSMYCTEPLSSFVIT